MGIKLGQIYARNKSATHSLARRLSLPAFVLCHQPAALLLQVQAARTERTVRSQFAHSSLAHKRLSPARCCAMCKPVCLLDSLCHRLARGPNLRPAAPPPSGCQTAPSRSRYAKRRLILQKGPPFLALPTGTLLTARSAAPSAKHLRQQQAQSRPRTPQIISPLCFPPLAPAGGLWGRPADRVSPRTGRPSARNQGRDRARRPAERARHPSLKRPGLCCSLRVSAPTSGEPFGVGVACAGSQSAELSTRAAELRGRTRVGGAARPEKPCADLRASRASRASKERPEGRRQKATLRAGDKFR